MDKFLLGIDIGGTAIKVGQFTKEGTLLEKWDIPTNKADSGKHILSEIAEAIQKRYDLSMIEGIGFGVPGPVSDGVVLNGVNLGWGQTYLAEEFYRYLPNRDITIKVSNDANVACAGEVFQGNAKGYKNVVFITLGTGVGGGILINGQIVDGYNGVGGELGHLVVDKVHQFACNCGKKGCLETVTSATGFVNLAKAKLEQSKEPSLLRQYDNFSAKRVFDMAKHGDKIALETVDEACDYLAYGMSLVAMSINPELFVIGGGVSNAGNFLIDAIRRHFFKYVYPFITEQKIVIASLGNDAGIYGAAYLVRQ